MDGTAWTAAALATVPIAAILVLMIGLRWPAARAGVVGAALAFVLGWAAFELDIPSLGVAGATRGAVAESTFTAATILWIILPALSIHQLQVRTGSVEVLRSAIGRLSADPRITALLVAWFFAVFMEGAAGFGTAVALAAPFLVSAGFDKVTAVVLAMLGHVAGVSFGAVGTPIIPQVAATGLAPLTLARATAPYHALLGWVLVAAILVMVSRAGVLAPGDPPFWRGRLWLWGVAAAALFLVPMAGLAWTVGPELPTLAGALFGGGAFVALLVWSRSRTVVPSVRGEPVAEHDRPVVVVRAAAPYLVLVALILVTRLLPPLQDALSRVIVSWSVAGGFSGSFAPLYHPGTMLAASFLVAALWQRAGRDTAAAAIVTTVRSLGAVVVALLAMLLLSRLMVHAGMVAVLADAAAVAAGGAWPLFAPLVGMLGTFVTGSATASNILFTDFQAATAANLGHGVAPLLGAQGFGAASGNAICPHNIIAAGATVGLEGREGEVLRATLPASLGYALLGGVLALLFFA